MYHVVISEDVQMDAKMLGNMNVIERKKKGVHGAIVSLITELQDFKNLLESPTTCTQILNQFEAQESRQEKSSVGFVEKLGFDKNQLPVCKNPMNEKQKDSEIGEKKVKEMWKKLVCKEREVEGKMKEVEFSRRFVEERAMELEARQKELDEGFRELELKKMEFTSKTAGIKSSYEGTQIKRSMLTLGGVAVKQERLSAKWDDNSHRIFTELCVDEVWKGNRPSTTLSKTGWANVQKQFNAITGKLYNKKQLKNHWDCMKSDWNLFDQLRQRHTVLGWNQEKKTIVADDAWWDAQIKINPKYAKFKNKDLSVIWFNYDILFGDGVAPENRALVPVGPSTVIKLKDENYFIDEGNAAAAVEGAEGSECGDSQASRQPGSDDIQIPVTSEKKTSSGTKRKKGAMSSKDGIDSLINMMASKSTESSFHTADAPSIRECMDKLEEIEEIPKKTPLYWYSQNLFTRPDMRTIFMKQRCDRSRVGWLEYNYSEYLNRKSA